VNAEGLERFLIKRGFPVLGIEVEGYKYHVYLSDRFEEAKALFQGLPEARELTFELVELPPPTFWDKVRVTWRSIFRRMS
jgi:hypothetical protein